MKIKMLMSNKHLKQGETYEAAYFANDERILIIDNGYEPIFMLTA